MTSKVWDKQHGGSHYQNFKIQPSKFVVENELLFPEGCAIKYICRHRLKGKKEDILKAIHFLEMILERDYPEKEIPKEDEENRVWYVGVTRTSQKLYIMAAKKEAQGYDIESLG